MTDIEQLIRDAGTELAIANDAATFARRPDGRVLAIQEFPRRTDPMWLLTEITDDTFRARQWVRHTRAAAIDQIKKWCNE